MIHETNDRNFLALLHQRIIDTESLLDVGCGPCLILDDLPYKHIIALDVHRPYLINRITNSGHILPLNADARLIGKLFVPKSFSAVSFMDSIEHFTKQDALDMLREAELIASKQVIVFTPRGFFPQDNVDHFGLNGEVFQTHRSSWEPEELERLGYEVTVMKGQHDQRNPAFVNTFGINHPPVDALLAIKNV
ncbi:class I SAM-dependent methyltransferase [Paenibacillus rhizovicinus]|uniref:Class I SAM-dependent methyltransferase n=1 Tax=Paenibacillus rhizovicinus TaxID=2704463 RepID=A0A6C0P531_9BACL|nr:class I SAM-dependent methyltransferase [Paenibacillus rhizovicinus]QHW33650.1 class I SAM-dependent methyltransferase [Paenibacillus rhizovicinus]